MAKDKAADQFDVTPWAEKLGFHFFSAAWVTVIACMCLAAMALALGALMVVVCFVLSPFIVG